MNRREFARYLAGGRILLAAAALDAQPGTPLVYFADGYHGGAKGHMPAGAWRDILNTLREIQAWKLGLDIEPESWDALLRDDPVSYRELKAYLESPAALPRVEMLGGTFSQPYGWAVNGESNIRQFVRGMQMIRRHFPKTAVLGWGWEGGFWWGKRPLQGTTLIDCALIPHQGLWDEAGIPEETARWHEPLIPFLLPGTPPPNFHSRSLIRTDAPGIEIPTIQVDADRALVRLFNAAGTESEFAVSFLMRPSRVELVELSGKALRELPVRREPDSRYTVRLAMPRFGLRTLRCELDRIRHG